MPEWLVILCVVFAYAQGFLTAWAISRDGKSPFWTAFLDTFTLRVLWRR